MYIWDYNQKANKWVKVIKPYEVVITNIKQQILLWLSENPLNIELGIDYRSVFKFEVFLQNEIEKVLEQYQSVIQDYNIKHSLIENEILILNIDIMVNNTTHSLTMQINNQG